MDKELQSSKQLNWGWNLVILIFTVCLIYYAQIFFFDGFHEESNREVISSSARISVFLFMMAFGASALHRLVKTPFTWWMRMNRRYLGVSFAISHLIHLAFLILLQQSFHPVFEMAATISLLGGGLAYLFLVLMLFTSFTSFAKYLSPKNWTLLHTIGGYWIWFIFFRSYSKKILIAEYSYLPIVLLLVGLLIIRLLTIKKKATAKA